jgi:predicted RNase H-like nuclease (RuvC/YqgF family)
MAINLRNVEPLSSKSLLMEQAMRRRAQSNDEPEHMMDMVSPDYEWLKEDKTAINHLVSQMYTSVGQLAQQMKRLEDLSDQSRLKLETEQKLLFKQIRTLNNLLKNQVDVFGSLERQLSDIEFKQNNVLPQIGIGLVAGLMSAITILATAPWLTVLIEKMRVVV